MADELDDFTAQLNKVDDGESKPATAAGMPGLPPGATPEQIAAIKAAQEMKAKLDEKPLTHEPLKGKVDLKWMDTQDSRCSSRTRMTCSDVFTLTFG